MGSLLIKPRSTYVISDVLLGFDDLVSRLGVDTDSLYKSVGVTSSLIATAGVTLPFSIVVGLFEAATKATEREDFGLLLSAHQGHLHTNRATQLMLEYDNVGAAFTAAIEHFDVHSTDPVWQLQVEGKRACINRLERLNCRVSSRQYTALVMANCLKSIRDLCGKNWQPEGVSFSHFAPDNPQLYNRHFGVTVLFEQEFTQIAFPAKDLQRDILKHEHCTLKDSVKVPLQNDPQAQSADKLLARVRALIRQSIHNGNCHQDTIANLLDMHPKKLQRYLYKMDTSFQDIRSQARVDEAEYYLKNSSIPITVISEILGYSETSALSRAFKDRHGATPSSWRKKTCAVRTT
jgi:AraC-like DNA-binding protein